MCSLLWLWLSGVREGLGRTNSDKGALGRGPSSKIAPPSGRYASIPPPPPVFYGNPAERPPPVVLQALVLARPG